MYRFAGFFSSMRVQRYSQWVSWCLVAIVGLLLIGFGAGCAGEISVNHNKCGDCPTDRCIDKGAGPVCVQCTNDNHCQTATSPTSKCIEQTCTCATKKDCPDGQFCAGDKGCVECRSDRDCSDPQRPSCGDDNRCYECNSGAQRACRPTGSNACEAGLQACRATGRWGICKGFKDCTSEQVCQAQKCVPKGDACPTPQERRCQGNCIDPQSDVKHCGECGKACLRGAVCQNGRCNCPPGFIQCSEGCIDLLTANAHCGKCERKCNAGNVCSGGTCITTCPTSTPTTCLGGCFNTQFSTQHCGTCGNACQPGEFCQNGRCECPPGTNRCGNTCVDVMVDRQHCGQCNRTCPAGNLCSQGKCTTTCPASTPDTCFGGCVDKQTSIKHCGQCGNTCRKLQRCEQGKCTCPTGYELCNGACVDPKTHVLHCGGCGNACQDTQVCAKGSCVAICPKETPNSCNRSCLSLETHPEHCGSCSNQCAPGLQCLKGTCACPSLLTLCQSSCTDTQTSPQHCGRCGNTCAGGETCINGECLSTQETGWTQFTKGADTKAYYVSSSKGADTNDGLSPDRPFKTITKGYNSLRNNKADWLLLKRGDVWTGSFPAWRKSGPSSRTPMLLGAYGTGPRPKLNTGDQHCLRLYYYANKPPIVHVAFTSFHCHANARPPDKYYPGVVLHHANNILFEDMHLQGYASAFWIDGSQSKDLNDITVRRSLFTDNFREPGSSNGVLIGCRNNALFEENIILRFGSAKTPSVGSHSVTSGCPGMVVRHNLFVGGRVADLRVSRGLVERNLFVGSPVAILVKGGTEKCTVKDNVILHGQAVNFVDGNTRNIGIYAATAHSALTLSGNIVAHSNKTGTPFYLHKDHSFSGNIAYKWGSKNYPPNATYTSPERTIFTYLSSAQKAPKIDALIDELRKQTKGNWRRQWAPKTLIEYFRKGFQKK